MIDLIARKHGFDESTISTKYLDLLKSREGGKLSEIWIPFRERAEKNGLPSRMFKCTLTAFLSAFPTLEQNVVAKRKSL